MKNMGWGPTKLKGRLAATGMYTSLTRMTESVPTGTYGQPPETPAAEDMLQHPEEGKYHDHD